MSDTVLTYLPVKARAEGIMIALNLAHIPFTYRTTVNWPEQKEEWTKSGFLPFGQLPVLHIDGMDIVQTLAIYQYISRNYLSKDMDEVTNVHLDIMMNGWNDLTVRYYRCAFHEKEKLPEFFSIERKNHLTNLENLYIRYGKRFMVSDVPTIADAFAYSAVVSMEQNSPDALEGFPTLKKWRADFESLDEVKAYKAM